MGDYNTRPPNPASDASPAAPSVARLGLLLALSAACGFGGFGIHVWAALLAWRHGGIVWGIVAFALPGVADVVVIVKSLWWGEWAYLLAVGSWGVLAVFLAILSPRRPR